jgi:hypothetical protein
MAARRLLGIVFTPSWLRVAQAEMSKDRAYSVRLFAVPLPVGCINEQSGAIEDSGMLQAVMRSIPTGALHCGGYGEIFMAVPQLLCYRTSFVVAPGLAQASMREILAAHLNDVPGDRSSLVVDASAHEVAAGGVRTMMVLAARRTSLEAYVRLFQDREWCLGGITTGEIARYNRWTLQSRGLSCRVALICSADTDSQEFSVWDRGILIASDTHYSYQRERGRLDGNVITGRSIDAQIDQIAQQVTKMIERTRTAARPIENILLGGALRNHPQLHESIHRLTGIPCEASQQIDRYMKILHETEKNSCFLMQEKSELGFFDDALGTIAPRVFSQQARRNGWRDDSNQSYT